MVCLVVWGIMSCIVACAVATATEEEKRQAKKIWCLTTPVLIFVALVGAAILSM